ncbi:cupin domain-containing protein [Tindallia californiensis]|uniref:Ethanolamine utilization protein EutQ n=1 Tax=Tindallia californiensis TaxID=159292 RepID=A0A1H3LRE5_9FIRM|nr:cupin domain-containing protein [Tindallia californiensis]SDY67012.1 ethanolamine utilization protein EutQ [Tindallia californiensis]
MQEISTQVIEEIVRKVIEEQMGKAAQDHNRQVDPSGIISIQAKKVQPAPFDTGKPGDQVAITDILSLEESPRLGAGIMELKDTSFEWLLTYDEVTYIIEGTLEILIEGRKVVGNAGDVIFIPKGSKIHFSTPHHTRFLYVAYPANWSENA